MFDILAIALRNIRRRGLRNALTASGLAIFVVIFILVSSLTLTAQTGLTESLSDLGGEIMVWDKEAFIPFLGTIPENYADRIENMTHVKNAVPQITWISTIEGQSFRLTIGVHPHHIPILYNYTMTEGRMINNHGEAAVGYLFANFLEKNVGENITVNGNPLPVVGIYKTDTWIDNAVIVPFTTAQEIFSLNNRASIITVTLTDAREIDSTVNQISQELPDAAAFKTWEVTAKIAPLVTSINWASSALFTTASIACFFGVTNIMLTSVFERTREIGILKALGAKGADITKIMVYESATLGTLGGLTGCLTSFALLTNGVLIPLTDTTSFRIFIFPEIFLYGLALSIAIPILATLYPVWKATRVRPSEVLRFG